MISPWKIWRNLIHVKERERDLDREVQAYIDLLTAEKVSAGLSEEEAGRQASMEFGGAEQTKEAVRDVRAGALLEQLWADVRYAVRGLRRSPGFAAATIVSLALGIGVNSAAFSSIHWLVLHPFPFPQLDRVITLWETASKAATHEAVSPANFFDWKQDNRSFESLAAYRSEDVTLSRGGDPERIQTGRVSAEFFRVFGMSPQYGRIFAVNDTEPGRDNEVVLSYRFWKTRLAADPALIGKSLVLGQRTYTVVGIMPPEFDYPLETDVWLPLALTGPEKAQRAARSLMVVGRLKPEIPLSAASADLQNIAGQLKARFPLTNESRGVRLIPIANLANGEGVGSRFIAVLFAAALFVMLLACANAANLLLARAASRQREIGIRSALGASGSRIVRQLLVEVALLSLTAAAAGVLFGAWNLEQTRNGVPAQALRYVPGLTRMHMDSITALYAVGLSLISGFLCSLPALVQLTGRGSVHRLLESLKESGRTSGAQSSRARIRSMIVIAESALAMLLLVGAGLMVQTFHHMLSFDRGFDTANSLSMQTALPDVKYQNAGQMRTFYSRVVRGFERIPGVTGAAASSYLQNAVPQPEGRRAPLPADPEAQLYAVTPDYFRVTKIPIQQGRAISASDGPESMPVAVISQMVAQHYWPGENAIQRRIQLGNGSRWVTVIGVCGDTKDWFTGQRHPAIFEAFAQSPQRNAALFLRTVKDPLLSVAEARRQVAAVDANQPVFEVDSMEHRTEVETSGVRAAARSMTTYAVIALLLAVTGIYSLSAYLMVQRTHEIGLRMALGADRLDIMRLAFRQSLGLAGSGLAIGLVAAIALARIMSSVLFNVITLDWKIFVEVAALLVGCAVLAAYLPARRASRVDPVLALRFT